MWIFFVLVTKYLTAKDISRKFSAINQNPTLTGHKKN